MSPTDLSDCLAAACEQEDDGDADEREEGDGGEETRHGAPPPTMNQVASSATPISIANA